MENENKNLIDVTEKRKKTIINILYFGIFFALSVVLVRYAFMPLLPFLVAYIVTLILNPIVNVLVKKFKFDRKSVSVFLCLFFYVIIGTALFFIFYEVIDWIVGLVKTLPDLYKDNIAPALTEVGGQIEEFVIRITNDPEFEIDGTFNEALDKIADMLVSVSSNFGKKVALSLPNVLIKTIVSIISTAFLLMDYDMICAFIHRQLPEKHSMMIKACGSHLGKVLKKYIVSYAIIMFITFTEIFVGLTIIGMKNAAAIAVLVAIFDILPIVGSGMIMFPWAVVELILGDLGVGIGLMILWAFVVIVRQIMEPKIVGNSVGLHPFLTLLAMLAGNFIYGGVGVLLLPVSLALCQSLNEAGIVHIYTHLEKEDKEKVRRGRLTEFSQKLADKIFNAVGTFFIRMWCNITDFFKEKKKKTKKEGKNQKK